MRCSAVFILILLGLSACETVEGLGRDVETAGRKVQQVAN